jgi:hypothetical protein
LLTTFCLYFGTEGVTNYSYSLITLCYPTIINIVLKKYSNSTKQTNVTNQNDFENTKQVVIIVHIFHQNQINHVADWQVS